MYRCISSPLTNSIGKSSEVFSRSPPIDEINSLLKGQGGPVVFYSELPTRPTETNLPPGAKRLGRTGAAMTLTSSGMA